MSVSTQKAKDQAEELRKAVEKVNEAPMETENKDMTIHKHKDDEFEMDILNLPPRKDVHKKNAKRIRIKINASLIRFIIVIMFILFIIGGVFWMN